MPHVFDIPLRACVSAGVDNLMFAGRNISATHVAFASTRVMATCAVIGQGVGTAAAIAVKENVQPAELAGRSDLMETIKQQLIKDDAYLIGVTNKDPNDVARSARVSASSEQAQGPAVNIISGETRAMFGPGGAPVGRRTESTHRWMSNPAQGLPAWIELAWDRPVRPAEVRLVFDTGQHRVLTLSHSDSYVERMVWGRPQPETVRDYVIEGRVDGAWHELVNESGNYQRLRVHTLSEAPLVDALRVRVTATNGLDHARICEVRVYEA